MFIGKEQSRIEKYDVISNFFTHSFYSIYLIIKEYVRTDEDLETLLFTLGAIQTAGLPDQQATRGYWDVITLDARDLLFYMSAVLSSIPSAGDQTCRLPSC